MIVGNFKSFLLDSLIVTDYWIQCHHLDSLWRKDVWMVSFGGNVLQLFPSGKVCPRIFWCICFCCCDIGWLCYLKWSRVGRFLVRTCYVEVVIVRLRLKQSIWGLTVTDFGYQLDMIGYQNSLVSLISINHFVFWSFQCLNHCWKNLLSYC